MQEHDRFATVSGCAAAGDYKRELVSSLDAVARPRMTKISHW